MNPSEDKDPVWKLLLQARKPEENPLFARNVLREVRNLGTPRPAGLFAGWFTLPRLGFAAAAAIVAIALTVFQLIPRSDQPNGPAIVDTPPTPPQSQSIAEATLLDVIPEAEDLTVEEFQDELEMIGYMDGLLAVQNIETLDDEALADLLF